MNPRSLKNLSQAKKIGLFLIGTTLMWSTGLPVYMGIASAASLTNVSDTIVNSAPSATTNHTLVWTTPTGVAAGETILVTFDPGTLGFTVGALVAADFVGETGISVVAPAGCGAPTNEAVLTSDADSFTLTVCPGDAIVPGVVTLPTINSRFTNPATPGSYIVRITGTQIDSADTRIAIVNSVSMTARVDTSFTFTVTGLATSTAVNGTSTDITTTATGIAFNTLVVGQIKTAAQRLNVTTNAQNGFQVTLVQNQNLLSSTGADIDLFKDSAATAVPTAWTAPLNTLGSENTYGHYGITSEDATLAAGDEFGSALFAGNIVTPRQVFYHTAPSDGTTANIGQTEVGFQIQIGSLQEAGNDYNNTLTYVATPIF